MASGIYERWKANTWKKLHDMVNDTINIALYGASYTFTATDDFYTTTSEIAGVGGYTTGGAALASKTVTEGATAVWDAADPQWTSATFSTYFAAIYDVTPCNTLICALDFGGVQTVTSGTFTIVFASSGIIRLT